jgi:hypothetical protein
MVTEIHLIIAYLVVVYISRLSCLGQKVTLASSEYINVLN